MSIKLRVKRPDLYLRHMWGALEQLPEDVFAEISLLLLLTSEEAKKSFASMEFNDPIPSEL